jgi:hypothetical protein
VPRNWNSSFITAKRRRLDSHISQIGPLRNDDKLEGFRFIARCLKLHALSHQTVFNLPAAPDLLKRRRDHDAEVGIARASERVKTRGRPHHTRAQQRDYTKDDHASSDTRQGFTPSS